MFSNAEQGEALLGESYDGPPRRSATQRSRYQPEFKQLFYLLLGLNLVTVVLVVSGLFSNVANLSAKFHDVKEIFPAVTMHQRLFTPNVLFYKILNPDQKGAWDSIMPTHGGFIRIDNPQQYGLSGGYPLNSTGGVKSESYCLSVFHQLHCLNSIREELQKPTQSRKRHDHEKLTPEQNEKHIQHCLDYLRQAIMCFGDMSLEKAYVNEDGNLTPGTSGWGASHTCKAWDEVFNIAESMNIYQETSLR